jgi:hypothetical protein
MRTRLYFRRQQHTLLRVGGYASRLHTLCSMRLFVLPPDEAIPVQVLLADQGGIALLYAGTCAQFRLCPHLVPRREQVPSVTEASG